MKFHLNKKQKTTAYTALAITALSLIIWIIYGGEIFTKTEVLVEVQDDLFGTTKEWKDQFIWGLDLSLLISGITILVSLIIMFFQRNKKENK